MFSRIRTRQHESLKFWDAVFIATPNPDLLDDAPSWRRDI